MLKDKTVYISLGPKGIKRRCWNYIYRPISVQATLPTYFSYDYLLLFTFSSLTCTCLQNDMKPLVVNGSDQFVH